MDTIKKLIATFFGAGFSPVAPGTMGTIGAAVLYGIVWVLGFGQWHVWLIILILACVANIWVGGWAENYYGTKDPQCVVIDEVAGYFLAVICWQTSWQACIVGVLAFRLFDITKPYPIHLLEKLPKGWGILLDDLMAGVYAFFMIFILSFGGAFLKINIGIIPIFWQW